MKTVKLHWMNDERTPRIIRVLDLKFDPATCTGDTFVTLQPCEVREFEVCMPDNASLYIKAWPNMVMLSYHVQTAPEQGDQPDEKPQEVADT